MRRIFLTKRAFGGYSLSLSLAAGERRGFKNLLKTGAKRANFHALCRQTFCQTFHTIFHKLVGNKPTDNKLACNQPVFNTPACNEVSVLLLVNPLNALCAAPSKPANARILSIKFCFCNFLRRQAFAKLFTNLSKLNLTSPPLQKASQIWF